MEKMLLQNIFDYVNQQVEPIIEEYRLLKLKNAMLEDEVKRLTHQIELLTQLLPETYQQQLKKAQPASTAAPTIPKNIQAWTKQYVEALKAQDNSLLNALSAQTPKNMDAMNDHAFEQLIQLLKEIVQTTYQHTQHTLAFFLKLFLACEAERAQCIRELVISNPSFCDMLKEDVQLFPLKVQFFMKYGDQEETRLYFKKMIYQYAKEIGEQSTRTELVQLFWVSFLYNCHKTFIQAYRASLKGLKRDGRTALYFKGLYAETPDKTVNQYKHTLATAQLLSDEQLKDVFKKIDKLRSDAKRAANPPFPLKKLFYIPDEQVPNLKRLPLLKNSRIQVELTSPKHIKRFSLKVLMHHATGKAYMSESDYKAFAIKVAPYEIHLEKSMLQYEATEATSYYDEQAKKQIDTIVEKQPRKVKKAVQPSEKKVQLHQKSKLAQVGYHYSLSDEKRWRLLQVAVNRFGLNSIAYTLATSTTRLKGRKRNSPAIAIWETDLERLRVHYFKNDFNWPYT